MKKILVVSMICLLELATWGYYSPEQGRWLSRDPLGDAASFDKIASDKSDFERQSLEYHSLQQPYLFSLNNGVDNFDYDGAWFVVDDLITGPVDEIVVLGGAAVFASVSTWVVLQQSQGLIDHLDAHIQKIQNLVDCSGPPDPNDPNWDPYNGWKKEIRAAIKNLKQKVKRINNKNKSKPLEDAIQRGEEVLKNNP